MCSTDVYDARTFFSSDPATSEIYPMAYTLSLHDALPIYAAIEVADVVIQTDQPSKIATAIAIAKATRRIVIANILLAIGVKVGIMTLGAFGIATLWEAVFADVGVSLLAILNAVSILKRKF